MLGGWMLRDWMLRDGDVRMTMRTRRGVLAVACGTLASGLPARKPRAAGMGLPGPEQRARLVEGAGKAVPALVFRTAEGAERSLQDYLGHGVVLNLWATWCGPCVEEMPSLDAMAAAVAGAGVAVLPLSSDRGGAAAVERFYAGRGIRNLPVLLDPGGAGARALGAGGLPTTLLIDKAGRELARVEGGADWGSAAAIAMVRRLGA